MVSLGQNGLIGVIVLVLQDIHHNINEHQLNVDRVSEQYQIHAILMHTELFLFDL